MDPETRIVASPVITAPRGKPGASLTALSEHDLEALYEEMLRAERRETPHGLHFEALKLSLLY